MIFITQGEESLKMGPLKKHTIGDKIRILHKSHPPSNSFTNRKPWDISRPSGPCEQSPCTDRAKLDPVRMQRSLSTNTSRQCSLQEHMSTSFIRCGQGLNYVWSQNGGKKREKWDHAQQVDRIIFGENMKLLIEALKGEYLLTLTGDSFVMLWVYN